MPIKQVLFRMTAAWLVCAVVACGALAQSKSADEVIADTDRAIELIAKGETDAAYRLLAPANDATFENDGA